MFNIFWTVRTSLLELTPGKLDNFVIFPKHSFPFDFNSACQPFSTFDHHVAVNVITLLFKAPTLGTPLVFFLVLNNCLSIFSIILELPFFFKLLTRLLVLRNYSC